MAKELVAVIDFGTSNSGALVAYYHDKEECKGQLLHEHQAVKEFPAYSKEPTVLAIKKDELERYYPYGSLKIDNVQNNGQILIGRDVINVLKKKNPKESSDWIVFDNIKMNLYNNKQTVESIAGKDYPLIDIIAIFLKYLKNDVDKWILDAKFHYGDSAIQWVVTIPAVWDKYAKEKMEKANQIVFGHDISKVLEPEGAAVHICCQQKLSTENKKILVVDCGGGTTDIVGFQVKKDALGKTYTEECIQSRGIPCAGTDIDELFWDFFVKVMSKKVPRFNNVAPKVVKETILYNYWKTNPVMKQVMMFEWYSIKHSFKFKDDDSDTIINYELNSRYTYWLDQNHNDVVTAIKDEDDGEYALVLSFNSKELKNEVFDPIVNKIIQEIGKAIKDYYSSFDYICLAGGLSELDLLCTRCKKTFGKKVYFADTSGDTRFLPGGTILQGAAYMHVNDLMLQRKSKLYYYIVFAYRLKSDNYEEIKDKLEWRYDDKQLFQNVLKEERKWFKPYTIEGKRYVDYFEPICQKNKTYKSYKTTANSISSSSSSMMIQIWSSPEMAIYYGDTESCESTKVHLEAKVSIDCSKYRNCNIRIDFNKVAENSYFEIEFFHDDGEVFKRERINGVSTIIGH